MHHSTADEAVSRVHPTRHQVLYLLPRRPQDKEQVWTFRRPSLASTVMGKMALAAPQQ